MERVADPVDYATGIEMEHVEDEVAAVRRLVPRPEEMLKLHDECTSCGLDIEPPERRVLGYDTCITCAERKELRNGRG